MAVESVGRWFLVNTHTSCTYFQRGFPVFIGLLAHCAGHTLPVLYTRRGFRGRLGGVMYERTYYTESGQ